MAGDGHIEIDGGGGVEGVGIVLVQHVANRGSIGIVGGLAEREGDLQFHKHYLSAVRVGMVGGGNGIGAPSVVVIEHHAELADFFIGVGIGAYIDHFVSRIDPHGFDSGKLRCFDVVQADRLTP